MDQPIPRARVLIAAVGAGAKLLEAGEFEERLEALEATLKRTSSRTSEACGFTVLLPNTVTLGPVSRGCRRSIGPPLAPGTQSR